MMNCPDCNTKMKLGDTYSPKHQDISVVVKCHSCGAMFYGFLRRNGVIGDRSHLETYGDKR